MAKKKSVLEKAMAVESKEEVIEETKVEVVSNPPKKAGPKITKEEVPEIEFPMQVISDSEIQSHKNTPLPSKNEVDAYIAMYNYVKLKIIDKSDIFKYNNRDWIKKSGWRKFIKPFNLSVKMIREDDLGKKNPNVYEDGVCPDGSPDVHAEVYIIVSVTGIKCPECGLEIKGQSIEAIGLKSKSEYWSDKWKNYGAYNRHNLIATARTRGENIGISDLVGLGDVSAEEIQSRNRGNTEGDEDIESAFGS